MTYIPKFQPQLNRGIPVPGRTRGSRDCGPRTLQMGIDKQTRGDNVPTISAIRRWIGRPGPQPTNVFDARDGLDGRKFRGRRPLRYWVKTRTDDVKAAVRAGKFVQCSIDYGTWNDLMKRTGDPYFRGGHSVGVYGEKKWRSGTVAWLLFDPLDDERRVGIPSGPRWVPRWKVIKALEAFGGGKGRCFAGVFGGGWKK